MAFKDLESIAEMFGELAGRSDEVQAVLELRHAQRRAVAKAYAADPWNKRKRRLYDKQPEVRAKRLRWCKLWRVRFYADPVNRAAKNERNRLWMAAKRATDPDYRPRELEQQRSRSRKVDRPHKRKTGLRKLPTPEQMAVIQRRDLGHDKVAKMLGVHSTWVQRVRAQIAAPLKWSDLSLARSCETQRRLGRKSFQGVSP